MKIRFPEALYLKVNSRTRFTLTLEVGDCFIDEKHNVISLLYLHATSAEFKLAESEETFFEPLVLSEKFLTTWRYAGTVYDETLTCFEDSTPLM